MALTCCLLVYIVDGDAGAFLLFLYGAYVRSRARKLYSISFDHREQTCIYCGRSGNSSSISAFECVTDCSITKENKRLTDTERKNMLTHTNTHLHEESGANALSFQFLEMLLWLVTFFFIRRHFYLFSWVLYERARYSLSVSNWQHAVCKQIFRFYFYCYWECYFAWHSHHFSWMDHCWTARSAWPFKFDLHMVWYSTSVCENSKCYAMPCRWMDCLVRWILIWWQGGGRWNNGKFI